MQLEWILLKDAYNETFVTLVRERFEHNPTATIDLVLYQTRRTPGNLSGLRA
jgi:hypothetical protein